MRFATVIAEHDFERKVNQVRDFLKKGHRVEARILQSRGTAEDVLDLALRIVAEVRDIAKPEYFEARSGDRIRMVGYTCDLVHVYNTASTYRPHFYNFLHFLSIYLSICQPISPSNCTEQLNKQTIYPSIHPPTQRPIHPARQPSIHPCIRNST